MNRYLESVICGFQPLICAPTLLGGYLIKSLGLVLLGVFITVGMAIIYPIIGFTGILGKDKEPYMDRDED